MAIALPPTLIRVLAAPLTRAILAEAPDAELRLIDAFSGTLAEWLAEGRIDLAILYASGVSARVQAEPLLTEQLHLITAPGRRVCRRRCDFADLSAHRLILPSKAHGLRRTLEAYAAARPGTALRVHVEADSFAAIIELVAGGLGASILPAASVSGDIAAGRLLAIPIVNPRGSSARCSWRRRATQRSPPARCGCCRSCAADPPARCRPRLVGPGCGTERICTPCRAPCSTRSGTAHVVEEMEDGTCVLYIDRHLVHEVSSPQAFEGLRAAGRRVRRPEATMAVVDHNIPTSPRDQPIEEPESRLQIETLEANVAAFGVPYIPIPRCAAGHRAHYRAGAGAFAARHDHRLRGQPHLHARRAGRAGVRHRHLGGGACAGDADAAAGAARNMRVRVDGVLGTGVTAKDVILAIIGRIGTGGGTGHAIEYAGETIRALDMAGRMTICNMSIEAGCAGGHDRAGPDHVRLPGRAAVRAGGRGAGTAAMAHWRTLPSDADAAFDRSRGRWMRPAIAPQVTWGTSPQAVLPIDRRMSPIRADVADGAARADVQRMLDYMGLTPGQSRWRGSPVDVAFHRQLHQCADRRTSARPRTGGAWPARGGRGAGAGGAGQRPGQAARPRPRGWPACLCEAGFEWREPGCSMCLGMNPDRHAARAALRQHVQPQFRGAAGAGRADAFAVAGDGGGCGRLRGF